MFGGQGRSFNAFWKDSFLADPWCEIGGTNNNQRGNGNRSQDGAAVLPPPMMPPPPSMLLIPANDLQQQHPGMFRFATESLIIIYNLSNIFNF